MTAARKLNDDEGYLRLVELYLQIRKNSLFSMLEQSVVRELLENEGEVRTFLAGQQIQRGATPHQLFLVGQGIVGLYPKRQREGRVAKVTEGRSLELGTLFRGSPAWEFDWIAETECEVLQLPWGPVREALRRDEVMDRYLERVTLHAEIQRLKNDLRLNGLSKRQIASFIAAGQPLDAAAIDATTANLVVLRTGDLELTFKGEGPRRTLAILVGGDYLWMPPPPPGVTFEFNRGTTCWVFPEAMIDRSQAPVEAFLRQADILAAKLPAAGGEDPAQIPVEEEAEEDEAEESATTGPELALNDFLAGAAADSPHLRKPISVRQHDEMDCGAACLATVAAYYRRRIGLPVFRSLVHVTREGSSLFSLKKAADRVGFASYGALSSITGLRKMQMPFVALLQYHFVVVYAVSDTEVTVGDPGRGVIAVPLAKFREEFSQNVLLLKPTPAFYAFPEAESSYRKYLQIFDGHRGQLLNIFGLSLLIFAMGLAPPMVSQFAIDTVVVDGKKDSIALMAALLLGFQAMMTIANLARDYLLNHFATAIDARFSCLFQRQAFSLPLSYYAVRRVGDFTSRMGELGKIRSFFSSKPLTVLLNIISVAMYTTVLAMICPKILGYTLLTLPLLAGLMLWSRPRLRAIQALLFKVGSRNASTMYEHLRSLDTLRSLRAQIAARWRWEVGVVESRTLSRRLMHLGTAISTWSSLLQGIFNTVTYLVAVQLFISNELTLGQVMAVSMLTGQILGPALGLVSEFNKVNDMKLSVDRVDDVITAATEPSQVETGDDARFRGDIEFRDVEFRYGNETSPLVVSKVSLKIAAGETVAFVGRSGSGKTTLAYLVSMLYAPTGGALFIDGRDAREIPLTSLRRQVAMVMQDCALFSGTIFDNIALGDRNPSFARGVAAAKRADAHGFVSNLKLGYSTILGEGGQGLSGGQRQRLNIARAFYLDPSVLILDEATSALDSLSEQTVMQNLLRKDARRTTLVIAHRLNTVLNADRIVVMDQGRIVEQGNHAALMDKQGAYFSMFRRQTLG